MSDMFSADILRRRKVQKVPLNVPVVTSNRLVRGALQIENWQPALQKKWKTFVWGPFVSLNSIPKNDRFTCGLVFPVSRQIFFKCLVFILFSHQLILLGDDMDKIFLNIVDSKIFCILLSNESCAAINTMSREQLLSLKERRKNFSLFRCLFCSMNSFRNCNICYLRCNTWMGCISSCLMLINWGIGKSWYVITTTTFHKKESERLRFQ